MGNAKVKGAKVAVVIGTRLLVIRRDADPAIAFPDMLDIPGGGVEPGETAIEAVLRETIEEVGLVLSEAQLEAPRTIAGQTGEVAGFLARLPASAEGHVVFGDEGQGWCLMSAATFISHPDTVPSLAGLVADYVKAGLIPET